MKVFAFFSVFLILLTAVPAAAAVYPPEIEEQIALYPQAQVLTTIRDGDRINVAFSSSDDPGAVADYLKETLQGKGWTLDRETVVGSSRTLIFEKESLTLSAALTPAEAEGCVVMLTLGPQ